ncbi:response regulator [Prochlorothrix hollandica]|uniref:Chemotaxis protein CheY n=1 Tax=Prochlorothrix hollandica PCC 9006 = CALU 1027 TaxID=317619 RepID=A0A0M2PTK0_PROHO|nr:response regulator [Prochlorothrix hollandica]KKI98477.1 chemotaxis protein CheY [Prochlorothrix hollandica PCC 9006 = CALU 1027]
MQGHLHEIDVRSILQLVEIGQRTGELFVEAFGNTASSSGWSDRNTKVSTSTPHHSWFVFFLNGQIIHATHLESGIKRLQDYLQRYHLAVDGDFLSQSALASVHAPEYGYLWALLENGLLTPAQGRSIIRSLTYETLFDLLSLHQGTFVFEMGSPLAPQLTTLEISPMILTIMKQIQEWKQFHPLIQSPDQRLAEGNLSALPGQVPSETLKVLEKWADGSHSLRRIARYFNSDILTLTRTLYPAVKAGVFHVLPPDTSFSLSPVPTLIPVEDDRPPRIVCIDDSAPLRKTVESQLNYWGYEVTSLGNPLKALSLLFELKPDLILCDIAMPTLNGYELCGMLRQSTAFRQIPIVMLTGKEGFTDRMLARMVGATDYLTKPFGPQELMMLVEKYVGPGHADRCEPDTLLRADLKEQLGN